MIYVRPSEMDSEDYADVRYMYMYTMYGVHVQYSTCTCKSTCTLYILFLIYTGTCMYVYICLMYM